MFGPFSPKKIVIICATHLQWFVMLGGGFDQLIRIIRLTSCCTKMGTLVAPCFYTIQLTLSFRFGRAMFLHRFE